MAKRTKEQRRAQKARSRENRLRSGALVEVAYRGRVLQVRPTVKAVMAEESLIRSAAAGKELDLAVSVADVGKTSTLHFQFNGWSTGDRVLDWWPGNGTWKRCDGQRGTELDWRAVLEIAAGSEGSVTVADLFNSISAE